MLVELLLGIRYRLGPFIFFLFMTCAFFSCLYGIMGASYGSRYGITAAFNAVINSFEIATGVMPSPSYPFWDKMIDLYPDSKIAYIMIYSIWVLWIIQQVMVFVILLNFLISLIT